VLKAYCPWFDGLGSISVLSWFYLGSIMVLSGRYLPWLVTSERMGCRTSYYGGDIRGSVEARQGKRRTGVGIERQELAAMGSRHSAGWATAHCWRRESGQG
jgi:hypothetical protein